MSDDIFYSYQKVLSYNAFINILIGERGVGKTFGFKEYAINHYKKTKKQFVYIRRYESDLKESVGSSNDNKFFEQVKIKFPNDNFSLTKSKKIIKLKLNDEVIGYALPLSASDSLKSVSFENVDTICYDEFQLKEGSTQHYLKNETEAILDIIETIGRLRDNLKVFLLGNAISSTSPIMNYFNLSLPYNSDIKTFKDGLILVNYIKNIKYREKKKETKLGRLIDGTRYGRYAIDNEFLTESKSFIKKKDKEARYYFTLVVEGKEYGVWRDYKTYCMYISDNIDKTCRVVLALDEYDHNEERVLVKSRSNPYIKNIIEYYKAGKLCFESQKIKNIMQENVLRYIY